MGKMGIKDFIVLEQLLSFWNMKAKLLFSYGCCKATLVIWNSMAQLHFFFFFFFLVSEADKIHTFSAGDYIVFSWTTVILQRLKW